MYNQLEPEQFRVNRSSGILASNRGLLSILLIAYVAMMALGFAMTGAGANSAAGTALSNIVALLFISELITVLALDFRGCTTLCGLINWRTTRGKSRFWLLFACIFFFLIWLGIYLVRATLIAYNVITPAYQRQAPYQAPIYTQSPYQVPHQAPTFQQGYYDEQPEPFYPNDTHDKEGN